jgi:uncharacterized protein with HEPN domain
MLECTDEVLSFINGRDRADLDGDRMLMHAITRCVELIGEAASRVSPDAQGALPDVPWQDIVGMRNRLIHIYFDVDLDVVWSTVTKDIPQLATLLRRALKDK